MLERSTALSRAPAFLGLRRFRYIRPGSREQLICRHYATDSPSQGFGSFSKNLRKRRKQETQVQRAVKSDTDTSKKVPRGSEPKPEVAKVGIEPEITSSAPLTPISTNSHVSTTPSSNPLFHIDSKDQRDPNIFMAEPFSFESLSLRLDSWVLFNHEANEIVLKRPRNSRIGEFLWRLLGSTSNSTAMARAKLWIRSLLDRNNDTVDPIANLKQMQDLRKGISFYAQMAGGSPPGKWDKAQDAEDLEKTVISAMRAVKRLETMLVAADSAVGTSDAHDRKLSMLRSIFPMKRKSPEEIDTELVIGKLMNGYKDNRVYCQVDARFREGNYAMSSVRITDKIMKEYLLAEPIPSPRNILLSLEQYMSSLLESLGPDDIPREKLSTDIVHIAIRQCLRQNNFSIPFKIIDATFNHPDVQQSITKYYFQQLGGVKLAYVPVTVHTIGQLVLSLCAWIQSYPFSMSYLSLFAFHGCLLTAFTALAASSGVYAVHRSAADASRLVWNEERRPSLAHKLKHLDDLRACRQIIDYYDDLVDLNIGNYQAILENSEVARKKEERFYILGLYGFLNSFWRKRKDKDCAVQVNDISWQVLSELDKRCLKPNASSEDQVYAAYKASSQIDRDRHFSWVEPDQDPAVIQWKKAPPYR